MSATGVAVVGAGIAGRLTALLLRRAGQEVTVFEQGPRRGWSGAGPAAGGMLAPVAERETAERIILECGRRALLLWPEIVRSLDQPVHFCTRGSLLLCHPEDRSLLDTYRDKLERRDLGAAMSHPGSTGVGEWEPELHSYFENGFLLREEAHLDPRELLEALATQLEHEGVLIHWGTEVTATGPGWIFSKEERKAFAVVVDARGLGLREAHPDVRGVRGEGLIVRAKDVTISRPVRLLHPRIPLYVIPRRDQHYYLGASSIETERHDGISLRTTVELMTAAVSVHAGFAEASLVEAVVGLRPALPDHIPRVRCDPRGLIAIVGLYRHGFLLAPEIAKTVVALVLHALDAGRLEPQSRALIQDWNHDHYSQR